MTEWSQIVRQYGPMVWRTAHRLLNNEADASDCFQRAFISALELERAQLIRNWRAVLKRLATARAVECLRRRRRESGRREDCQDRLIIDRKTVGPVQAAEAGELAGRLREAVAMPDDQQAQVFCLACLEDLSYQDIAGQLGITVNHVGVLLHRARANLQERLRAEGFAPAAGRPRREVEP
jgi:RNA polymerase sigma-70 factor (ECF subfamily)